MTEPLPEPAWREDVETDYGVCRKPECMTLACRAYRVMAEELAAREADLRECLQLVDDGERYCDYPDCTACQRARVLLERLKEFLRQGDGR